jgi:hypothetical protein
VSEYVEGTVVPGVLDNGNWSACFGLSYRDLSLADALGPQQIIRPGGGELRKVCGSGGIAAGRNEVAAQFLDATDGEWLWFVDSDMGFRPDTVARLVAAADPAERPVLGALAFCLLGDGHADLYAERYLVQPTLYAYRDTGDEVGFQPIGDYPADQVVEVSGTGAACLLIHRELLEAIRSKYGDAWFDPIVHPTGNHGRPRTFSEDLSFCVRVAGVGAPLHVDTSIKTTHHKGGIYLDEEMFARQQAFRAYDDSLAGGDES